MSVISLQARRNGRLAVIAGVAMAAAGLLHLALAPVHMEHSFEHGLALFGVGVGGAVWTIVWLRRRSPLAVSAGMALATASLFLYAITRLLPLPFEGEPEPVDGFGLATQLCEAVGLASLGGFALFSGMSARRLAVVIGSAVAGAAVLLAAASYASLVSGSRP